MYLIKWIDNGEEKTFVAEGVIEKIAVLEEKILEGFDPTYEII